MAKTTQNLYGPKAKYLRYEPQQKGGKKKIKFLIKMSSEKKSNLLYVRQFETFKFSYIHFLAFSMWLGATISIALRGEKK
jgi:hypothetical protein